jgi:hypothetical protein
MPQLEYALGDILFFQQDGTAPHFLRNVTECLNGHLTVNCINESGFTKWPPRSPELRLLPLIFFIGGHVIYNPPIPQNVN